jgi:competence protein ComGC
MKTRSAFTFVEIMVTVFFLGVCILPLMSHIQHTTRATGHTQDRALAMTVASQTIERFRALGHEQLTALCGGAGISETELASDPLLKMDNFAPSVKARMETDNYKRTITFSDVTDPRLTSPAPAWAKVGLLTVKIDWQPPKLPASTLSVSKIIVAY